MVNENLKFNTRGKCIGEFLILPKYDPNVDKLKNGKTYAFDGDEVKIVDSNDIETL